jgi:hypothetical protein
VPLKPRMGLEVRNENWTVSSFLFLSGSNRGVHFRHQIHSPKRIKSCNERWSRLVSFYHTPVLICNCYVQHSTESFLK